MDLYLVRHAEAADKAVDPARNLTERGRRDAAALARALQPLRIRVRAIWHSGKPRAFQTAEAFAAVVECSGEGLVAHAGLKPFDGVKKLARALEQIDESIMIVGHEPFLGRLAARVITGHGSWPLLSLDKPSIACLRRDAAGDWRVAWLLSRESLGRTADIADAAAEPPTRPESPVAEEHDLTDADAQQ